MSDKFTYRGFEIEPHADGSGYVVVENGKALTPMQSLDACHDFIDQEKRRRAKEQK